MERKIIFATGNQYKMKEIRMILENLGIPVSSMKEAGIDVDIVEDGTTFEENAMIKAEAIAIGIPVSSMKEAGIDVDIVEDGTTFEENAMIKAEAIAKLTDAIVLADDSGLEIDYLNKEPGIYSARYAGTDTSYEIKNNLLLQRLEGVPDEKRTARFVCAIAAVFPDGSKETVRGCSVWKEFRMRSAQQDLSVQSQQYFQMEAKRL